MESNVSSMPKVEIKASLRVEFRTPRGVTAWIAKQMPDDDEDRFVLDISAVGLAEEEARFMLRATALAIAEALE